MGRIGTSATAATTVSWSRRASASSWYGIGAPRGTPTAAVGRLNAEINAGLADLGVQARLAELGGTALPGTPADLGRLIAAETETWGKVIRAANIRVE